MSATVSDQTFSEEDLLRFLLDEQVWINNELVDTMEAEAAKNKKSNNPDAKIQYLRESVFPTLVPALHQMLKELNKTIVDATPLVAKKDSTDATRPCPYRTVATGGQPATSSETFGQADTHTSLLRRREVFESSVSGTNPSAVVDTITNLTSSAAAQQQAVSATPFYGPTGRSHPVEYLAQLLMRSNHLQSDPSAAGDAQAVRGKHPYVVIDRAAATQNKPGYW